MKIVITDYIEPDLEWEVAELAQQGHACAVFQLKQADAAGLSAVTRDADVVVVNMAKIHAELIATWTKCRLVIRHGIGYDNVDVEALTAHGIQFINVPDYCVEEVAEQAIALLFNVARKVSLSRAMLDRSVPKQQWDFSGIEPMFQMRGQTLGIVGLGRIGTRVYQKLESFGFKFSVCDPYLSAERAKKLGVVPKSLEEVLRESDLVTLHLPLNEETHKLINPQTLAWMKPTAYLVNTARGGLIDHPALVHAVQHGEIAGAALDVFEHEPPCADDPILTEPRILLTPHLSWYSVEAGWDIRRKIVRQIEKFAAGEPNDNRINELAPQLR